MREVLSSSKEEKAKERPNARDVPRSEASPVALRSHTARPVSVLLFSRGPSSPCREGTITTILSKPSLLTSESSTIFKEAALRARTRMGPAERPERLRSDCHGA